MGEYTSAPKTLLASRGKLKCSVPATCWRNGDGVFVRCPSTSVLLSESIQCAIMPLKSALVASLFLHLEGCRHWRFHFSGWRDSWSHESPFILCVQSAGGIGSGIAGGCDSVQHSSVMNELKWLHENDILVEALSAALRASAATTVWQWACVEHKVFAGVLGGTCFLFVFRNGGTLRSVPFRPRGLKKYSSCLPSYPCDVCVELSVNTVVYEKLRMWERGLPIFMGGQLSFGRYLQRTCSGVRYELPLWSKVLYFATRTGVHCT